MLVTIKLALGRERGGGEREKSALQCSREATLPDSDCEHNDFQVTQEDDLRILSKI
jgi:hypothetical protein